MSKATDTARQRAFQKGQEAWREGKDCDRDNPYPSVSPDHDAWRQGWEQEEKIQKE